MSQLLDNQCKGPAAVSDPGTGQELRLGDPAVPGQVCPTAGDGDTWPPGARGVPAAGGVTGSPVPSPRTCQAPAETPSAPNPRGAVADEPDQLLLSMSFCGTSRYYSDHLHLYVYIFQV